MKVKPFCAYRFDGNVTHDAGACIAPPYDVIDKDQQEELYQRNPYNIVRIMCGKQYDTDNANSNVYTRAAAHLADFLSDGALAQDKTESFYVYSQLFTVNGESYRRTGFIGLGELQEYGGNIKPHEKTLAGPKADRLNLMRATGIQEGQIFMLYSDPEKTIDAILARACNGTAVLKGTDDDGVVHELYTITDPTDIKTMQTTLEQKNVFIADGHHRYETSLNFMNESKLESTKYCMMTFVNTHNEGLVVLPTHRLIRDVKNFDAGKLMTAMSNDFDIARMDYSDIVDKKNKLKDVIDAMKIELETGNHAFGMYFNDGAFYIATLKDVAIMDDLAPENGKAWRNLDVSILHKAILEQHLGIDQAALEAESNVDYIKDLGDAVMYAIDKVDRGESQGLFLMNTVPPSSVEDVAATGEKMPQKSTFFYPKIFSGLTVNKVR
ncbi:MAG: DUF1015 domain-containing protein [Sedimentisphaerales bacterium]|nr:DUF1015 domain-containing protein [Sedimentisphaerales bacterium]MBN2842531.1 DUF1015 domain-containing protein [Sedimentisphaerales bacterium]